MPRVTRVKGGQKNPNSGQRWNKKELSHILNLYIKNPDLKIHETNPEVIKLAASLNRTIRSVEAQLLMFRNLDRFGFYGFKKMNNLCKELWKEYIDSTLPA